MEPASPTGLVLEPLARTGDEARWQLRSLLTQGSTHLVADADDDEPTHAVVPFGIEQLTPADVFDRLFDSIKDNAPLLTPTGTNSTFLPPFPMVPRNAALSIQFSDLLDHASISRETVRLKLGSPPIFGFEARVIPDPNHGAFLGGIFRTTRVLIDTTISQFEGGGVALALNSVGMPPSPGAGLANAAIRVPTRLDASVAQFSLLRNASGGQVQFTDNGPNESNATRDVVRAFRTGGGTDPSNGFLRDSESPTIRGVQPISLPTAPIAVAPDEAQGDVVADESVGSGPFVGTGTFSDRVFIAAINFSTVSCAQRPDVGDFLIVNGSSNPEIFAEVTRTSAPPQGSLVTDVRVRLLRIAGLSQTLLAAEFAGATAGRFESTFRPGAGVLPECFLQISPPPGLPPTAGVSTTPRITLRFSEPMDPGSVLPFDNFRLDRAVAPATPTPAEVVVGAVTPDPTLREFRYSPMIPLDHILGSTEVYEFSVAGGAAGVTDLAGNPLVDTLPASLPVTLSAGANETRTGGIVLRFSSFNEFGLDDGAATPVLFPEVRDGQIERDFARGTIRPRPVQHFSKVIDSATPTYQQASVTANCGAIFGSLPINTETPLHPRGSRLMTLWRYCDLGVPLFDEDTMNIDVEGMSWSPMAGSVFSDFFGQFEISLSHSSQLPDGGGQGFVSTATPGTFPMSGLSPTFDSNVLVDPENTPAVVHSRDRGYLLTPMDAFAAPTDGIGGTNTVATMMPYPMNRGIPVEEFEYFTWRDTAIQAFGGPGGIGTHPVDFLDTFFGGITGGICIDAETASGNINDPNDPLMLFQLHPPGLVPSIGLPLLAEFKCFPRQHRCGAQHPRDGLHEYGLRRGFHPVVDAARDADLLHWRR